MGFSLNERLSIVLRYSWKAQLAIVVILGVTLGTFLLMKQVTLTLAESVLISEVAQTASFFHAEWVAAMVVLFAMLVAFSEIVRREWDRLEQR